MFEKVIFGALQVGAGGSMQSLILSINYDNVV